MEKVIFYNYVGIIKHDKQICISVFEKDFEFYTQKINEKHEVEEMIKINMFDYEKDFISMVDLDLEDYKIKVYVGSDALYSLLIENNKVFVLKFEKLKSLFNLFLKFENSFYQEINELINSKEKETIKETKQVIILRDDVRNIEGNKVQKGKYVAQGSHGAVANIIKLLRNNVNFSEDLELKKNENFLLHLEVKTSNPLHNWLTTAFTKPVLACHSEEELLNIYNEAINNGLTASLIQDNGLTEFGGVKTYTAVAIGPDCIEEINKITGNLKPFK